MKKFLARNLRNVFGWRTRRKLLVIESDDWGAVRMPSLESYNGLLRTGLRVDRCPYSRLDSPETQEDFQALFEVLSSVKDSRGKSAVITANTIVANPDFDKIRASGFDEYKFELFPVSIHRWTSRGNILDSIKEGIEAGVYYPQLHGREHLQVERWMSALRQGSEETLAAFNFHVFGVGTNVTSEVRRSYLAAFDYETEAAVLPMAGIVKEAADLFFSMFGYRSKSFIPPNYVWDSALGAELKDTGISYMQGLRFFSRPHGSRSLKSVRHIGGLEDTDQLQIVRNCFFEPSLGAPEVEFRRCLQEINTAFAWNKPAVVCSHRVNFVGGLSIQNRSRSLELLRSLLNEVVRRHPSVEFVSTSELGDIIARDQGFSF